MATKKNRNRNPDPLGQLAIDVNAALARYEATKDHDHGRGPVVGEYIGGDCLACALRRAVRRGGF